MQCNFGMPLIEEGVGQKWPTLMLAAVNRFASCGFGMHAGEMLQREPNKRPSNNVPPSPLYCAAFAPSRVSICVLHSVRPHFLLPSPRLSTIRFQYN